MDADVNESCAIDPTLSRSDMKFPTSFYLSDLSGLFVHRFWAHLISNHLAKIKGFGTVLQLRSVIVRPLQLYVHPTLVSHLLTTSYQLPLPCMFRNLLLLYHFRLICRPYRVLYARLARGLFIFESRNNWGEIRPHRLRLYVCQRIENCLSVDEDISSIRCITVLVGQRFSCRSLQRCLQLIPQSSFYTQSCILGVLKIFFVCQSRISFLLLFLALAAFSFITKTVFAYVIVLLCFESGLVSQEMMFIPVCMVSQCNTFVCSSEKARHTCNVVSCNFTSLKLMFSRAKSSGDACRLICIRFRYVCSWAANWKYHQIESFQ